jgi:UDP-N-acetylmuramate--alanine ligase
MDSIKGGLQMPADLEAPHMVGILGDGQSALAALLRHDGAQVSGCDAGGQRGDEKQGELRVHLRQLGISIASGHDPAHIRPDITAVVFSNAMSPDNAELRNARSRCLPVLRRHEALGRYAGLFRQVIAVAGGAGKTSTCALLGTILAPTMMRPTVYLGARSPNLDGRNYLAGARGVLVTEADEYMDGFLSLPRTIGVLGPVMAFDHRDYFSTAAEVTDSFTAFAAALDLVVVDADSATAIQAARAARRVISVGYCHDADYRVADVQPAAGTWRIVSRHGRTALGLYAVNRSPALWLNASRAAVTALELGVPAAVIRDGIREYRGVSRRLELRYRGSGVLLFDDYAHNPDQIEALASALRAYYPGHRVIGIFEPRQHRRTALYCNEFGQALAKFDACLLLPISPGLGDQKYGHTASLSAVRDAIIPHSRTRVLLSDGYQHAATMLASVVRVGDVVVSFGTGSPYQVLDHLVPMLDRVVANPGGLPGAQ